MSAHTEVVVYYLLITSRAPVVFKSKGLSIGRTLNTNSYQLLSDSKTVSFNERSYEKLEIIEVGNYYPATCSFIEVALPN
jgi:hypothetical protein